MVVVALDGGDFPAFACHGERDARARGLAIDEHRARAADAVLATEGGASQLQFIAQEVAKVHPGLGFPPETAAIYLNGNRIQVSYSACLRSAKTPDCSRARSTQAVKSFRSMASRSGSAVRTAARS